MLLLLTVCFLFYFVYPASTSELVKVPEEHKRKVMDIVFNQIAEHYAHRLRPNLAWREFYQGTVPTLVNWTMSREERVSDLQDKWQWLPGNQTSDFPKLANNFETIRSLFTQAFFEKSRNQGANFTQEFFNLICDDKYLEESKEGRHEHLACLLDKYATETIPRSVKKCEKLVSTESLTKAARNSLTLLSKLHNKYYVDERSLFDQDPFKTIFQHV